MISCLHDRFLDGQLLPTPHLYFLYLVAPFERLSSLAADLAINLFKNLISKERTLIVNYLPWGVVEFKQA